MFQFSPFAPRTYEFSARYRASPVGFPIRISAALAPVCRLTAAFRRLLRPSSPVIAKASTTYTWSLDPITLRPSARRIPCDPFQSNALFSLASEFP